jgi:hypothetical protein
MEKFFALFSGSVNCWPSVSGGESYVNIEYEASKAFELQNVIIQIPLPALRDPPTVNQVDGEWRFVELFIQICLLPTFIIEKWSSKCTTTAFLAVNGIFLFVLSDMTLGGPSWSGLLC